MVREAKTAGLLASFFVWVISTPRLSVTPLSVPPLSVRNALHTPVCPSQRPSSQLDQRFTILFPCPRSGQYRSRRGLTLFHVLIALWILIGVGVCVWRFVARQYQWHGERRGELRQWCSQRAIMLEQQLLAHTGQTQVELKRWCSQRALPLEQQLLAHTGQTQTLAGLVSSLGRIAEDGQWALDTCLSERRWLAYLSQTKSTRPGGAEAFACLYVSNAERRVFERRNNASITDAFTALPRMPAPIYCPKVLDVNSESGAALLSDALQAFPSELALVHSLAKEVLDVNSESGASLTPAALQAFPLELALVHSLAKEVIAPGCSPPSRPAGLPLGACSRAFLSQGGYGSVPPPITSTHHQVLDLDSKSGAAFLSDALQAFPSELALVRASAKETFTLPYATTATSTAGLGVVFPVLQQHPFPTSPLQQQQAQAAVVGAVTTTINLTAVVQSVLAEIFASSTPSTRDRNRTAVVQSVLAEIFSSSTPSTRDRNRTAVVQSVLAEIFSSSTPSIRDRNRTAVVQSVLAEIFSSSTPSTRDQHRTAVVQSMLAEIFSSSTPSTRDRNRTAVVQSVLAEIFSSSTPSTRDQHRTAVVQSMLAEIFSSSTPSTRDRNRTAVVQSVLAEIFSSSTPSTRDRNRTAVVQSVLAEIFSSSTPSTRDRNRTAVVQSVLAEIFSSSTPSTRSDRSVELYDTTDLAAPLMLASPMPLLFQPQPGQPVAPLLPLPPSVLRVWEMRAIVNLTLPSAGPRRYQVWCSRFTEPPSWFVEYRMPILWTLLVLALLVTQSPPVPPTVRPNRFTEPPSRFMECGMPTLFTLLVLAIVTRLPPACPFSPTCFQTRFTEPPSWYMEYVMPTLFTLLVPALVALVAVVACPQRRQFTEPPSRFEEYVPPTLFTLLVLALVALVAVVASLQRRQYEQSRRAAVEADAMRAEAEGAERSKSCFVASMTHELRTPMLGIIGMLDVLSDSHLSSNQLSDLSTARTSALKVLKLVNQVLDLSKLEAGRLQLEPGGFDVHAWVEGVVGRRWAEAQERNLHLAAVVDADVPPQLVGDQLRLAQVLSQVMGGCSLTCRLFCSVFEVPIRVYHKSSHGWAVQFGYYALSFTPHGGYVLVRVAVVDAHVPMAQLAQWNASCAAASSARVTTLIGSDDVTITGDADAAAAAAAAATACFAGSAGPCGEKQSCCQAMAARNTLNTRKRPGYGKSSVCDCRGAEPCNLRGPCIRGNCTSGISGNRIMGGSSNHTVHVDCDCHYGGRRGAAAGGAMQLVVTCEHSGCDNSETMNGFMFRFEEMRSLQEGAEEAAAKLSLVLAKQLVTLMKGDMSCKVDPVTGTAFTLAIPILSAPPQLPQTSLSSTALHQINLSHTSLPFLKAVFPAATPATAPAVDAAPSAQVDGWENHGTMAMGAMVTMMLGGMGRDLSADLSGVLVVADGQPERAKLTSRVLTHLGASVLLANDEQAAASFLADSHTSHQRSSRSHSHQQHLVKLCGKQVVVVVSGEAGLKSPALLGIVVLVAKGGLSEGADEGTETRKGAVGGGDRREQQRVGMTDGQKRADAFTTGSSEGDSEGTENSGEVGGGDRGEQQGPYSSHQHRLHHPPRYTSTSR
ncbi:unnamed protein product [Closterium sp. NIES-65]|nr:unnamed protein product [Closterium sp. NIES-65]